MKKLIPFFAFLLFTFEFVKAQAPQATSYQAVIRNSSGNVLSNQLVKVRFSIRDSAANGTVVYQETQTPTTNAQGLINLFAGQGTAVAGTFASINWGNKSKFLQTEIDTTGGNNYTDMGTMQLMSVPYALYSNVANTATTAANGLPTGTSNGDILYWNGTSWQKLTAGTYGQSLTICDGVPTWGGCSPKITTTSASAVSYTTATSGGNVTAEGGVSVTARGVCWSTALNPTIALATKTVNGTGSGSFTSSITGLTSSTTYYVRAYATNSVGTSYGTQQTFTTASAVVLPSVTIGTQVWTNQNLSVARYRNGDVIPQVTNATQWAALTTGAWCWYNNDSATYAATYGRLYNWYAVNDARGLAPQGWHIPSDGEWNKLVKYLDAGADTTCANCAQSYIAGGAMKSTTGWNAPNTGATNSSGFAGLPGGYRTLDDGAFLSIGLYGHWWSSTEFSTADAWNRLLKYDYSVVIRSNLGKRFGFSVRCVRD